MATFSATAPARFATRLTFFTAGFVMACCAPLFPFIKDNVGADETQFGLLLLCFGLGSIIAMPLTGFVAARQGPRSMVLLGGFGLIIFLPTLTIAETPFILGSFLFLFGASLGTIDVAMNIHGVAVEAKEKRSLMSNFHAQFSIGGLFGAGLMTLLLSVGVPLVMTATIGATLALLAMLLTTPRLLHVKVADQSTFVFPRGIVLLLGLLAGITFLVEGAVLDWGALLVIERQLTTPQSAGVGYILFSAAMVIARLTGGHIVTALGELWVLILGGIVTILGIATVLLATLPLVALVGFVLIGLGSANLVPIFFSVAGRQTVMPASLAIASVTTIAYSGVLVGPAMIGFAADLTSLPMAFWLLTLLIACVPFTAFVVTKH